MSRTRPAIYNRDSRETQRVYQTPERGCDLFLEEGEKGGKNKLYLYYTDKPKRKEKNFTT